MVFIVTGKQGEGKTTLLRMLVDQLKAGQIAVSGFYAEGTWKNDQRSGFSLNDIQSGLAKVLCQTGKKKSWLQYGRFYFDPSVIRWGEELLKKGLAGQADLFVIDEIGKFELEGRVWSPVFKKLIEQKKKVLVTVRETLVAEFIDGFSIDTYQLIRVGEPVEKITDRILDFLT